MTELTTTPPGKYPAWLLDRVANVYSQTGEDGVLAAVFEIIPPEPNPWCVEFGAWDGVHLSNTRNLVETRGFTPVLIEADKTRFRDLKATYRDKPEACLINAMVGFGPEDNLDCLLADTAIPYDFELLSIDIDGNDYHVWKAMTRYRPKVVIIEYNPTIPTPVRFVQQANPRRNQGCSLLSLVELGREKGYELVCALTMNAVFVRQEDYPAFGLTTNEPEALRLEQPLVTWVFSGYDGRIFIEGHRWLPWHKLELRETDFQVVPRRLRQQHTFYSPTQRLLFRMFRWLREHWRQRR